MARLIKSSIFCISLFFFSAPIAFSQWYPDNEYRRFSTALTGGAALGDRNRNFHFMSSNFTGNVQDTPIFGMGVQYALSPAWSLELGYHRVQVKGISRPFKTNMDLLSLKNILNLNQLIFVNQLSNRINPYLTAGVGYDFFNYDGPQAQFSDHNTSLNAGAGLAYRLSNTVDLFTHYEYHLGSNTIDNEKDGWGADLINTLTGGVRINFGKKEAKHLSWRTVPLNLKESDYNKYLTQADQIKSLKSQLKENDLINQEKELKYTVVIDSLMAYIDYLENRNDDNTFIFANRDFVEAKSNLQISDYLSGGHYVQIFATRHPIVAGYIKGHAHQTLMDELKNSNLEIMVYHRKDFYEVVIGRFDTVDQARLIKEKMAVIHADAFVITFPRPVDLPTEPEQFVKTSSKDSLSPYYYNWTNLSFSKEK